MKPINLPNASWRTYQQRTKKRNALNSLIKTALKFSFVFAFIVFTLYVVDDKLGDATNYHEWSHRSTTPRESAVQVQPEKHLLSKSDVRSLLNDAHLTYIKDKSFEFTHKGKKLLVETSLDISLQRFIQKKLQTSTSRYIGIVVMDPATGKILTMAGYDKDEPNNNPCIDSKFPAASIFKIITAAAAIEKCNFSPGSEFTFNGRKHTLYKSQLREKNNKYTNRITLKDSFAQSVNPVFGKLGANHLGGSVLETYAEAFGFNRKIEFEISVDPSSTRITDEPYHWAEIASGFNRQTTISPLHGAIMTTAILKQGMLIEPSIVDHITDESGNVVYRSELHTINQAISPRASEMMNTLMAATITSGTARKTFRGHRRDRVLSQLHIGGKTGSIDNKIGDARFDWFVGFAEEKKGSKQIVISALVAHEKYIGIRAAQYARMTMKHYFKDYFTKTRLKKGHASQS